MNVCIWIHNECQTDSKPPADVDSVELVQSRPTVSVEAVDPVRLGSDGAVGQVLKVVLLQTYAIFKTTYSTHQKKLSIPPCLTTVDIVWSRPLCDRCMTVVRPLHDRCATVA